MMYNPYKFFYFPRIYPGGYIRDSGFSGGVFKSEYLTEVNRLQQKINSIEEKIGYVNVETVNEIKQLLLNFKDVNLGELTNTEDVVLLINSALADFDLTNNITIIDVKREVNNALSKIDVGLTELQIRQLINREISSLDVGLSQQAIQYLIDESLAMIDSGMNHNDVVILINEALEGIEPGVSEVRVNEIITSRLGIITNNDDKLNSLEQQVNGVRSDVDINITLTKELQRQLDLIDISSGVAGERGPIGQTGPRGFQGEPGIQGPEGRQGPRGEQGGLGMTGERGPKGDAGPPGIKGDTGIEGPMGPTGPEGLQGEIGPKGEDGFVQYDKLTPEQIISLKGDKGDKGDIGFRGERGPRGEDGNVAFESLTPEQVELIRGPRGYKGEPGETGQRGVTGDTGLRGVQGPPGPQGPPGSGSGGLTDEQLQQLQEFDGRINHNYTLIQEIRDILGLNSQGPGPGEPEPIPGPDETPTPEQPDWPYGEIGVDGDTYNYRGLDPSKPPLTLTDVQRETTLIHGLPLQNDLSIYVEGEDHTNIDIVGLPLGLRYDPRFDFIYGTPQFPKNWGDGVDYRDYEVTFTTNTNTITLMLTMNKRNYNRSDFITFKPIESYIGLDRTDSTSHSELSVDNKKAIVMVDGVPIEPFSVIFDEVNSFGDFKSDINISNLPNGITYNPVTNTISGTPHHTWGERDRELSLSCRIVPKHPYIHVINVFLFKTNDDVNVRVYPDGKGFYRKYWDESLGMEVWPELDENGRPIYPGHP